MTGLDSRRSRGGLLLQALQADSLRRAPASVCPLLASCIGSEALYDRIGYGYRGIRRADTRLAEPIHRALGDARRVINVGAGAGSYEPDDREVVAVEPSAVMIAQRPAGAAPAIQASAEQLPFEDDSFDAAMAIITLHHWNDAAAGLAEMVRVARDRVVVVGFDEKLAKEQWIARDYLPETPHKSPPIEEVLQVLPGAHVEPIPIPRDCTDRMFLTLWARPEQHLDADVRAATSIWHVVSPEAARRAVEHLRRDLASGAWDERYGHLRELEELDVGLRLIRADHLR
jgi:SAM-dependent methyltransferase